MCDCITNADGKQEDCFTCQQTSTDPKVVMVIDEMLAWARSGETTGGMVSAHVLATLADEVESLRTTITRLREALENICVWKRQGWMTSGRTAEELTEIAQKTLNDIDTEGNGGE